MESYTLQWHHNGRDSVSNHQPHDCLLNRLFRRRSNKTSQLRVTGLCEGISPETGEFPAQMTSYAENVFIWWRHHGNVLWRHISLLLPHCFTDKMLAFSVANHCVNQCLDYRQLDPEVQISYEIYIEIQTVLFTKKMQFEVPSEKCPRICLIHACVIIMVGEGLATHDTWTSVCMVFNWFEYKDKFTNNRYFCLKRGFAYGTALKV